MKSKNGVVLLTVIVSILVMTLILTTIVISANGIVENTRKKQFAREIYLIQSSVDTYIARNSGLKIFLDSDEVVLLTSDLAEDDISQFTDNDETIIEGNIKSLKEINLYEIDVENVIFGNKEDGEDDIYLVSSKTGKVYYKKGVTINGETYYTLTDELKKVK